MNRRRSIIRRMIRIYRMWLLIRLIEQTFINSPQHPFTRATLCAKFCGKKKWLGRGKNYNADEALQAYFMARSRGYLEERGNLVDGRVYVKDEGFYMTSPTYLVSELSKSIAAVGALTAVIISAAALYISISK